jgi:pyrroline-5-carboxylate reductase
LPKLAILGTGVMGSAILQAVLKEKIFAPVEILTIDIDTQKLKKIQRQGVQISTNLNDAAQAKILLLAIKPQQIETALQNFTTHNLVISILAGVKIARLKKLTGSQKIIRAMPNTPAKIQAGITGFFATKTISDLEKNQAKKVLSATGKIIEFKQEKLLNAVTAISGSGPAYFFAFAENLVNTAKKLGLSKSAATNLVRETFLGAAKLAENSDEDWKILRENVTSKGGATAAALAEFEKLGLTKIITQAIQAAKKRAENLST